MRVEACQENDKSEKNKSDSVWVFEICSVVALSGLPW